MPSPLPTILYLDDDEGNLRVLEFSFLNKYSVLTATTVPEARKHLASNEVQVVLSDQRMPEMLGTVFLASIMEAHPDVIRIIVTAYTDIDLVVTAVNECGIFRYITKPWNLAELERTLDAAIETYGLRRQNRELMTALSSANLDLRDSLNRLERLNAEVMSYSLKLVKKNENLEQVHEMLRGLYGQMEEGRNAVHSAVTQIQQNMKNDQRWTDFLARFEEAQSEFARALRQRAPRLTNHDLKLCALLRLNLSTKEVADILGISASSANMARYRLRKKLGLDSETGLEEFLAQY